MRGLPLAPGEGLTLTAYTAEPGTPSHDGLKLPASLTGLGPRTGQAILVAAWYAGLTALALAFAYRGRGLGRPPGAVIITGYLAFVNALAITITQARVSPAAAAVPAAVITWPVRYCSPGHRYRRGARQRPGGPPGGSGDPCCPDGTSAACGR